MANQFRIQVIPDFADRYPDASARATECAMNLAFTADLMVKRITELVGPFDLSPASGLVLSMLADSEAAVAPKEIADKLIISRATATGLVNSLEKRGYVRRGQHPSDRRSVLVEITDSGREVADAFRPIVHQQQRQWFEVLSAAEQAQLIDSLQRLQRVLMDRD